MARPIYRYPVGETYVLIRASDHASAREQAPSNKRDKLELKEADGTWTSLSVRGPIRPDYGCDRALGIAIDCLQVFIDSAEDNEEYVQSQEILRAIRDAPALWLGHRGQRVEGKMPEYLDIEVLS